MTEAEKKDLMEAIEKLDEARPRLDGAAARVSQTVAKAEKFLTQQCGICTPAFVDTDEETVCFSEYASGYELGCQLGYDDTSGEYRITVRPVRRKQDAESDLDDLRPWEPYSQSLPWGDVSREIQLATAKHLPRLLQHTLTEVDGLVGSVAGVELEADGIMENGDDDDEDDYREIESEL